jgi:hypothetical protein
MEKLKEKKEYCDFHVEIEKSVAQRLYQHCEKMDDKVTSVIRRSLRLYLEAEEQKNQLNQL